MPRGGWDTHGGELSRRLNCYLEDWVREASHLYFSPAEPHVPWESYMDRMARERLESCKPKWMVEYVGLRAILAVKKKRLTAT